MRWCGLPGVVRYNGPNLAKYMLVSWQSRPRDQGRTQTLQYKWLQGEAMCASQPPTLRERCAGCSELSLSYQHNEGISDAVHELLLESDVERLIGEEIVSRQSVPAPCS